VIPEITQKPGCCLRLAFAGKDSLVVAARPVHCLCGGEIGEVPSMLADDLGDPPEDTQ
jgi:hypothetical protein